MPKWELEKKIFNVTALNPCPNCNGYQIELVELDVEQGAGVAVECLNCGTRGQIAYTALNTSESTENRAVEFWNQMGDAIREYPRLIERIKAIDNLTSELLRGKK
jgi:hypothetical protein